MINTQGDNNGPSPDLEHNSTGPQGGQQAGKYAALYRGEITRKKTLAQRLVELLRDGKEIQKTERTRWQRNRLMYRGEQYLRVVNNSVRTLAPSDKLPNGRRRDTVNMIKPFVDGRVATITYQRPPFKVLPNSNEQDARDAARLATNFLRAMWDVNGWDLDRKFRELNITAEIDGVSFLNVYYDRFGGDATDVFTDLTTGQPISDPQTLEAMQIQDPLGQGGTWKKETVHQGNVVFRVVRPGNLAVDSVSQKFEDCRWIIESRVVSRDYVEREAGMTIEQLLARSKQQVGEVKYGQGESRPALPAQQNLEDEDGTQRKISSDAVLIHEIFLKPTSENGDFPMGLHAKWIDAAFGDPYVAEPWGHDLPYKPYTPRPDGGHYMRARGTVDELAPVQVRWNRTLSQVGEWLDRVARPPLVVAAGALRSKSVYNEEGVVQVHGGYPEPHFMTTPSEPSAVLSNHLDWLRGVMAEISTQHDAARGQAPGKGIEAAAALNMLVQQNEQNLSATAAEYVAVLEWGCSTALKAVAQNYTLPRMVQLPGMDDAHDLVAFMGSSLKGAHQFKVTGSILPKQRAAQLQTIMGMAQYGGIDIRSWATELIEDDVDGIVKLERAQEQRQKRETSKILALGTLPDRDQKFQELQHLVTQYGTMAMELGPEELEARGIKPPTLANVGVDVPTPDYFDKDEEHIFAMQETLLSDGYEALHPLVKQALREHHMAHLQRIGQRLDQNASLHGGSSDGARPMQPPNSESGDKKPNGNEQQQKPGDGGDEQQQGPPKQEGNQPPADPGN